MDNGPDDVELSVIIVSYNTAHAVLESTATVLLLAKTCCAGARPSVAPGVPNHRVVVAHGASHRLRRAAYAWIA